MKNNGTASLPTRTPAAGETGKQNKKTASGNGLFGEELRKENDSECHPPIYLQVYDH